MLTGLYCWGWSYLLVLVILLNLIFWFLLLLFRMDYLWALGYRFYGGEIIIPLGGG